MAIAASISLGSVDSLEATQSKQMILYCRGGQGGTRRQDRGPKTVYSAGYCEFVANCLECHTQYRGSYCNHEGKARELLND